MIKKLSPNQEAHVWKIQDTYFEKYGTVLINQRIPIVGYNKASLHGLSWKKVIDIKWVWIHVDLKTSVLVPYVKFTLQGYQWLKTWV